MVHSYFRENPPMLTHQRGSDKHAARNVGLQRQEVQLKRGCHRIQNTVCESVIYEVKGIWSFICAHFELHILEQKNEAHVQTIHIA